MSIETSLPGMNANSEFGLETNENGTTLSAETSSSVLGVNNNVKISLGIDDDIELNYSYQHKNPLFQIDLDFSINIPNPFDDDNEETNYREKTSGANAHDRQQVDNVARESNVDRRDFGDFIEETKALEGRGPSDNYTYKELQELAKEFKELN
ncbi:MAG: hypothetical protein LBV20_06985 [Treponema sp.]|nr:hypothetical protein [Treponema sp.]